MGVEWPDRRKDVLNALDILASPNPSAEWPTLTEAVHWLVDDTFWDMRDPGEDVGALLIDEHEAAAVRSVVSAVAAASKRQGPTAPEQAWLDARSVCAGGRARRGSRSTRRVRRRHL